MLIKAFQYSSGSAGGYICPSLPRAPGVSAHPVRDRGPHRAASTQAASSRCGHSYKTPSQAKFLALTFHNKIFKKTCKQKCSLFLLLPFLTSIQYLNLASVYSGKTSQSPRRRFFLPELHDMYISFSSQNYTLALHFNTGATEKAASEIWYTFSKQRHCPCRSPSRVTHQVLRNLMWAKGYSLTVKVEI